MARTTPGSTGYFLDAGALSELDSATVVSYAAWVHRPSTGTTAGFGAYQVQSRFGLIHFSDDVVYWSVENNNAPTFGSAASATSGWHHYAGVFDGSQSGDANRFKAFIDAAPQTLSFTGTVSDTLASTVSAWRVGMDNSGSDRFWAGSYAEMAIWLAALAQADIDMLALGVSPLLVRPDALRRYWLLDRKPGQNEPELIGGATAVENGGNTIASSDHPAVLYPRRRQIVVPSAAVSSALLKQMQHHGAFLGGHL